MASALISRGPQRIATLETLIEASERSSSSASSARLEAKRNEKSTGRHFSPSTVIPESDFGQRPHSLKGPGVITEEIVHQYGAALALHDLEAERRRVASDIGNFTVIVVGKNEAHGTLCSALRTAVNQKQKRTLIHLRGDLFEEAETLELTGQVLIQPDPGNSTARPVIRIIGPHVGIKCTTASADITFANVRLELDSPLRKPMHSVQVCSKPLVHPATNNHCSVEKGFVSGGSGSPSSCIHICMGKIVLQSCLVLNLTGDGLVVAGHGMVVLKDTHVKATGRHGVVVASEGVASLTGSILSGCGGCGW